MNEHMRQCGECSACCFVGAIPEIGKPANTLCFNYDTKCKNCSVHGTPAKPPSCVGFTCAWLNGIGDTEDRPDKSGVMLSINNRGWGDFILAIETRAQAIETSGQKILKRMLEKIHLPMIVVRFGSSPESAGDLITLRDEMHGKFHKLTAKQVTPIGGVPTYEIVRQ